MSLRIRSARPSDSIGIAKVHVETWRLAYPGLVPDRHLLSLSVEIQAERWRRLIREPIDGDTLVADGGRDGILGFGSSGPSRRREDPAKGEIYTLYVAGDHQGLGLGRALLTALLRGLHRRGYADAFLWVLARNPSRFFYEAMGGQLAGLQREAFAGALLEEEAYRWSDLADWLTARSKSGEG